MNETEDSASQAEDSGVSLHAALKPSAAGLSFAVESSGGDGVTIKVQIECAVYRRIAVDDTGSEIEGAPADRAHERWRRVSLEAELSVELASGETRVDLEPHGIAGMELYVLVTPHAGVTTVTAALSNQRTRGGSSAYDEEQHFFQVRLSIVDVSGGAFAPRPSRRAQTDEDSRTAALIYRDVKEYVVGHTSSARAVLRKGNAVSLHTDWVPAVVVPGVSDRGDAVFDSIRETGERRPLDAAWLASASAGDLAGGLADVVAAYRTWISKEEKRVTTFPDDCQPQARKHIERCRCGADRMDEGIEAVRGDADVAKAFQLAQTAMQLQFGWARSGAALTWRPFQLAFQLLVLASLAERSHPDRETMDLLWFPTGGGKTEAYLALTAFVIMLRRLRRAEQDDGSGVAVLMRYTLRLLTIQQFQRAAAMICACELLRRQGEARVGGVPNLGKSPIGIGLWVGAKATPLTLHDALNRPAGDPSTPEQLTACPCCGGSLKWKLTPRESSVECTEEEAVRTL